MSQLRNSTIQKIIEWHFFLATATFIFMTMIGAFYFNSRSVEILHDMNIEKTHEILSHILVPALKISDSTEIRRFLKITSDSEKFYSVIDENKNILTSDYEQLTLLKSVIGSQINNLTCHSINKKYVQLNNHTYSVHCSYLADNGILNPKQNLGILLSVTTDFRMVLSPMIIYFIGTAIISLLLTIIFLRYMLNKRIVRPLLQLNEHIASQTVFSVSGDPSAHSHITDPSEVIAIRDAFDKVMQELRHEYQKRSESEKREVLLKMAASVAHDIRSPLAVMEITLLTLKQYCPESQHDLLSDSIQSIRDISNNLLERYRDPENTTSEQVSLLNLVEQVVCQKYQEWSDNPCHVSISVDQSARLKQLNVAPNDIKRILSNLLNNAYEAQVEKQTIQVTICDDNQYQKLIIKDNGCGIPVDKIDDVLNGLSLKHAGAGLGLSSAKNYLESISGKLNLTSVYGEYTELVLLFPLASG